VAFNNFAMKNILRITFVVLMVFNLGCEKEELDNRIIGQWVEEEFKSDTLIFESRGNLLKIKSVSKQHLEFLYEIVEDSIGLQWVYSSGIYRPNFHYFSVEDDRLSIGNFYVDSLESNTLLKFNKIQF